MITEQIEVIGLLSKEYNRELTINQISKYIKKSYAFTNKYVRELIDQEILAKKFVGSAILCSLNFYNENTIGLLILSSINNKILYFKKLTPDKRAKIAGFIDSIEDTHHHLVYMKDNRITIVAEDKAQFNAIKLGGFEIEVLNKTEFKLSVSKIDYSKLVILKNHEAYWRLVGKMV
ncbi:hypothetical protein JW930_07800 [Candidatus Woesearchaeota archaeon]|nr:hypothetical protein [Candidatus Woesearchaeota archaeon]